MTDTTHIPPPGKQVVRLLPDGKVSEPGTILELPFHARDGLRVKVMWRDGTTVLCPIDNLREVAGWVAKTIDIVFDDDNAFVEVEDEHGRSMNLGEWVKRDDGYYVLRFHAIIREEPHG